MDATPANSKPGPLQEALRLLQGRAGATPRAIVKVAGQALAKGRPETGWLIADRLVRRELRNGATALILRASASATLGRADEAAADLDRARAISPNNTLLVETQLAAADPARWISAARLWLSGSDPGRRDKALTRLRVDGCKVVIASRIEGDMVVAAAWWSGDKAIVFSCSDGERTAPLPPAPIVATGRTDFAWSAELSLRWPADCEALELLADRSPSLCEPALLRRPEAVEPVPPAATAALPADTPRRLMIVIPVHSDLKATLACIASVLEAAPDTMPRRLVVIDDASPDAALSQALSGLAEAGAFLYRRNPLNLGFARSVNRALALREPDEDVLLLNADTLVPTGAIARLAATAVSEPEIGTVTPLSNNGEDTSFPQRFADNPMPARAELEALDRLAAQANPGRLVDMPNGVGFCLYVKREVLAAVGPLPTRYGRGYYEDVELCLRAEAAGFRNVCAADTVVGHLGSRSFKDEKRALVRSNLRKVEQHFPGYRARTAAFFRDDPLLPAVQRLDMMWLRQNAPGCRLLVIPPGLPGWLGALLAEATPADGLKPVVAACSVEPDRTMVTLRARAGLPQNLALSLPAGDANGMRVLLAACRFGAVLLVDPQHLPGELAAACRQSGLPLQSAAASCENLSLTASDPPDLVTSAMAASVWAAAAGGQPVIAHRPVRAGVPVRAATDPALALLAEDDDAACWSLALACAAAADPARVLAYLGAPGDAQPHDRLWVTGAISREDSPAWLARAGVSACFFASRRFGLADPRLDDWLARGGAAAWFDPVVRQPRFETLRLRLPTSLPDDEVGACIARWLDGLASPG
jgi:GT2 family glycosyltransferase